MILGNVNANQETIVQLAVLGENRKNQGIKAVIDTTRSLSPLFNQYLTC